MLTTTRTVRKRLDFSRPVDRSTVLECLELAFQAPNGSNMQQYSWVLVDDPAIRTAMAEIYRGGLLDQVSRKFDLGGEKPKYPNTEAQHRITESVMYLHDHLEQVPVLVVPTIRGRLDGASIFNQASLWGSVLPAVWSFMLALRTRGLGSAWTTIHLHREQQMAELLGIPFDRVTQAGLFPVAYTLGTDFRAADRSASTASVRWNHW